MYTLTGLRPAVSLHAQTLFRMLSARHLAEQNGLLRLLSA